MIRKSNPELHRDLIVGCDCILKSTLADWWEWRGGSSLFFWRWPLEVRNIARDGHPIWVQDTLPRYRRPQRKEQDPTLCDQIRLKLENVISKGYIGKGEVVSLTSYFAVPKGTSNVRMVYDSTCSGLNSAIWVPSFSLPSVDTLTDRLDITSWMSDLDMGEQFLNFPLDQDLQPYCGIDVCPYLGTSPGTQTLWLRWARCMMGLKSSPYVAIKGTHLAEEATQPWVSRRRTDGRIAADAPRFVDDLRPVGPSEDECWEATHTRATRYCYLGLQISS